MGTTKEYRVVCARYGERGHGQHTWAKKTEAKAKQAVIDNNHHAEVVVASTHFYTQEAPYRVQVREVTDWEDA